MRMSQYSCPQCREQKLQASGSTLRCTTCGNHYPILDGLPALVLHSGYATRAYVELTRMANQLCRTRDSL